MMRVVWRATLLFALVLNIPFAAFAQSEQCHLLRQELASHAANRQVSPTRLRRFEFAIRRQHQALLQAEAQIRQLGCGSSGGFFLFGQPSHPQCPRVEAHLGRMRANFEQLQQQYSRMQNRGGANDPARQRIIAALNRHNCNRNQGYRARTDPAQPNYHPSPRGEQLQPLPHRYSRGFSANASYRTLCVRRCDGGFFPISFATYPRYFERDQNLCQARCPSAEVALYVHRNPGEEVAQSQSVEGVLYRDLPNANRYRKEVVAGCSCSPVTLALERGDGSSREGDPGQDVGPHGSTEPEQPSAQRSQSGGSSVGDALSAETEARGFNLDLNPMTEPDQQTAPLQDFGPIGQPIDQLKAFEDLVRRALTPVDQ